MSKFVIISNSSFILTGWLYAIQKLAINVIFVILSLIINYSSFKLAVAIYKGLFIGRFLFYILYNPCVFIQSGDVVQYYFWPIKA